jgi:hypothetical protein
MNTTFDISGIGTAIIAWIIGSILVGFAGINRKGGFLRAFLVSLLLSPLAGIIITVGGGQKNPRGCPHCGNDQNEAEFCGICGKNEEGLTREMSQLNN